MSDKPTEQVGVPLTESQMRSIRDQWAARIIAEARATWEAAGGRRCDA